MTLSTQLASTPHRETSGSRVYAAFEYQLMFGVELLFEKFSQLEDYAVLFEFHDDVVLLTGTADPTEIEFFQLKHTTSGNWTIAKLIRCPKKNKTESIRGPSIIQKLYQNVVAFEDFTKNAQVVSNSFCSEIGEQQSAKFSTVSTEDKEKLLNNLRDMDDEVSSDCLEVLGFRRTELDKSSCYELIKGRVHTFLQKHVGGDAFQLQSCADAIVTQCRLRNKKLATDVPANIAEIVAQKGVSKHDLNKWLLDIKVSRRAPDWSTIQPHLSNDWPFAELNSVRNAYENYKVIALDSSNDAQNATVRCVRDKLEKVVVSDPLFAFVDDFVDDQDLKAEAKKNGYALVQLKAMLLYEVFKSEQTGKIQEVDSKPSDKVE